MLGVSDAQPINNEKTQPRRQAVVLVGALSGCVGVAKQLCGSHSKCSLLSQVPPDLKPPLSPRGWPATPSIRPPRRPRQHSKATFKSVHSRPSPTTRRRPGSGAEGLLTRSLLHISPSPGPANKANYPVPPALSANP